MALPPNLIIFNSNKKMVQLSKVVSNLKFTLDTCMFQISSFEDRFSKEFQDIFNSHGSIISKIITDINNHKEKIASENFKMYSQNHEKMQSQYIQFVESLITSINLEEKQFIKEIENLKKEISEITIKISHLTSSVTEPLSDIFSDATKETVPILKAKFQDELRLHDEESEKKYNALKDKITKKFEEYNLSYAKAIDNLKKQFIATSKDSEIMKEVINSKEKCQVLRREILQLKETFLILQKEYENQIKSLKEKCSNEIIDFQKAALDNNQQLSTINSQLESMELLNYDEINLLNEKIRFSKEKYLEEITKLQSQIAQLLLDHKVEIEQKRSLHQTNESFFEQFIKLKEQLKNKLNEINEENEKEHLRLIENNQNLQTQSDELLSSIQNENNKNLTKFQAQKEEHSKEIAKLKDEQDDDLHLEYARFESKMAVLLKKLGQNKSLISDTKCAEDTKKELENELIELRLTIENENKEFDISFQKEKESLSNQNELSLKAFQEKEERNFAEIQEKLKSQIDQYLQEYQDQKKLLISILKQQYDDTINQIPKHFKDNNIIPAMIQDFNNQYKNLKSVLNDEMVEVVHETNEKQLQELLLEKNNLLSHINNEKSQLLSKMSSLEEDEQKRHGFALSTLVPNHKESEIEEFREKCKSKINNLIQRQDDLLFTLRKLKEQDQSQTIISVSGYLEDDEVIRLRKFLEELRNDLKNQRHNKKIDLEESVAKKQEEIENTSKKIESDIEKAKKFIENVKENNKNEIEAIKDEAKKRYHEILKSIEIEKDSIKGRIEIVQNQINEKINRLRETVSNEKNENSKKQNDFRIEAEKNLINNHMKITETYERLNSEINLLKNKHEEFEKQSNEMIKVYEKICEKSKKKAETIPMRPEEMNEIKRLEGILDQKTQQLTLVAKDLIGYKNHLKQQEDEYNKRFGVAPQVAVLNNGDNRRQTKSAALVKKPLPPLKNSSVIV